ncbi:hypothetical protein [Dongshaea marina]|uniref:hypothetical protein n=1 Tax=Dongshaea marina TaxID=2047966 RepID=UPI000D3E78A8|nr:hypothetical protein [Dongshaea marina]
MTDLTLSLTSSKTACNVSDEITLSASFTGDDSLLEKIEFYGCEKSKWSEEDIGDLISSDTPPNPRAAWTAPSKKSDTVYIFTAKGLQKDGSQLGELVTCNITVKKDPAEQNNTPYENGSQNLGYCSDGTNWGFGWGDANFSIKAQNKWSLTLGIAQDITVGAKSYTLIGGSTSINFAVGLDVNCTAKIELALLEKKLSFKGFKCKYQSDKVVAEEFDTKLQKSEVIMSMMNFTNSELNAVGQKIATNTQSIQTNAQNITAQTNRIDTSIQRIDDNEMSIVNVALSVDDTEAELRSCTTRVDQVSAQVQQVSTRVDNAETAINTVGGVAMTTAAIMMFS